MSTNPLFEKWNKNGNANNKEASRSMNCSLKLPAHLTVQQSGNMYDTRHTHWQTRPPLRKEYKRHFHQINTTQQLKSTLRAGEYIWPGKYRLAFVTAKCTFLSFSAVRKELAVVISAFRKSNNDGWRVNGLMDVEHFDEPVYCNHSGEQIGGPPPFDHCKFYRSVVIHGNGEPTNEAYQLAEELAADDYDYAQIGRIVIDLGMIE